MLVFEDSSGTRPKSYPVNSQSKLFKHLMEGNARYEDRSFMNPVPNLIRDAEGNRLCVFTFFAFGDCGPAVYFYDFIAGKEIAKATGAQLFLAYKPLDGQPSTTLPPSRNQNITDRLG